MTTPAERTRALIEARAILRSITIDTLDRDLLFRAIRCLRHFPTKGDIAMAADECDLFAEPPKEETNKKHLQRPS